MIQSYALAFLRPVNIIVNDSLANGVVRGVTYLLTYCSSTDIVETTVSVSYLDHF